MTPRSSAPVSVADALRDAEAQLSPAELRVARYLVSHPEEVVFRSAVQLAQVTETSDATVIRTAKVLGFSGLPELKHVIGSELMMTTPAARRLASKISVVRGSDDETLMDTIVQEATERLGELRRLFDTDDFHRAVDALAGAQRALEAFAIHDAIASVWTLVDELNGYLTEQEPWKVAKDDSQTERLHTILATAAEGLRALAVLLSPVLPQATAKLWRALGAEAALGALTDQRIPDAGAWGQLPAGSQTEPLEALFPRIEHEASA